MTRFVEREFPRLVSALDLYVGSLPVAEELAQEALLRACMRWRDVSAMDSPGGWTYRIALNLATSHLRRRQAERRANRRLAAEPSAAVGSGADTADRLAVRAAVLALPWTQRAAVICRYFLGMTAPEAAMALGATPEAVRAATSRAVQSLRRELGPALDVDIGEEHADA